MDKKNTLLLTVIAVATLLVAVVGATFAYFSVTATNTANTSVVTADTAAVGTVTLSTTNQALKIHTDAADFSQGNIGDDFHSVLTSSDANYATSANLLPIFTAASSNSNGATYTCTSTVSITKGGTMASQLAAGDAELVLSGAATGTYDLATDTLPTSITFDNVVDNGPVVLNAEVILHNTSAVQNGATNNISGKTLTVTFESTAFSCVTK